MSRKLRGHILNFKHEVERVDLKCCESVFKFSRNIFSNMLQQGHLNIWNSSINYGPRIQCLRLWGNISFKLSQKPTIKQVGFGGFSKTIKSLLGKGKSEVELGELCWEHRAYDIMKNSQSTNTNKKEELLIYDQHYF